MCVVNFQCFFFCNVQHILVVMYAKHSSCFPVCHSGPVLDRLRIPDNQGGLCVGCRCGGVYRVNYYLFFLLAMFVYDFCCGWGCACWLRMPDHLGGRVMDRLRMPDNGVGFGLCADGMKTSRYLVVIGL